MISSYLISIVVGSALQTLMPHTFWTALLAALLVLALLAALKFHHFPATLVLLPLVSGETKIDALESTTLPFLLFINLFIVATLAWFISRPCTAHKKTPLLDVPTKSYQSVSTLTQASSMSEQNLSKAQYEALSEFRYQLRRFIHFSESAAKAAGVTPLQYLLMLHIRGFPGKDWATVGELAERLQLQHHGTVALVTRCEEAGLIKRQKSEADRRSVEIHLEPKGLELLSQLASLHELELQSLRDTFQVARITAFNDADGVDSERLKSE
ncbi:MarR family winged helix-turn-helix transcriptional regulator [Chitinolyticbacter meiyuanensis]|uniref:MarR family winged helix-turn-helix transcriptional regulator n=1 Tax=Chitinolyticbacter meiyuanensis TaxID=682798 RepID=UPI001FE48796|nr:MarR family winged helix-turn-helix transcriptional regulator [Chitinolyticbacter meiyuanensis]